MDAPTQASSEEFNPDSPGVADPTALEAAIAGVEKEIKELQFPGFTAADALALGLILVEYGTSRNLPIAIDITRGGQTLFHVALEGATGDNDLWAAAKSRTAMRYLAPSLLVGLRGRRNGGRMESNAWWDHSRFAAHGGSFPVYVKNAGAVATVTVSGLHQQADHDVVVEAMRQHLAAAKNRVSRRSRSTAKSGE
jgi:uncharacterized protein (UPF0303 family)